MYICIYIYTYVRAVGSVVHIWGVSGSISGPHFRVDKRSTSETAINTVVSEVDCKQSFQEGVEVFVAPLWCLIEKNRFFKKIGGHPLFLFVGSGGCWWMLALDCKKGCGNKKPIEQRFFATPFLRGRGGSKQERGQKKTPFLKTGRKWLHPFGPTHNTKNTTKSKSKRVKPKNFEL